MVVVLECRAHGGKERWVYKEAIRSISLGYPYMWADVELSRTHRSCSGPKCFVYDGDYSENGMKLSKGR